MPYARDLMGEGSPAEQALLNGDIGPVYVSSSLSSLTGGIQFTGGTQSAAATIGGPNGATILECNGSSGAALTFLSTTPQDRVYTVSNVSGNTLTIFTPVNGTFQIGSATASVAVTAAGVNFITRLGPIPFPGGSIISDRWIIK